MRMHVRLSLLARVLCLIVVALMGSGVCGVGEAWGQPLLTGLPNQNSGGVTDLQQIVNIDQILNQNGLGNAAASGGSSGEDAEGVKAQQEGHVLHTASGRGANLESAQSVSYGAPGDDRSAVYVEIPNREVRIPKLPPVEGFQQIAGSEVIKTMFKNMITEPVPVMFQTMMMVENGAATGFIGSMNSVSNLFANKMQASDLQLKFMDAAVSNNEHKVAYVESVFESIKEKNKGLWPAALSYSTGDKPEEKPSTAYQSYTANDNPAGSSTKDIAEAASGGSGENTDYTLSKFLFTATHGEQNTQNLSAFKDDLTKWVGDYKISSDGNEPLTQVSKPEFVPPTEQRKGPYANNAYIIGYEWKVYKESESAWKAINKVMKEYCEFKKTNSNESKEIFEKERPSKAIKDIKDWGKTQSIDIGLTINFIDQFFKLMLSRKILKELKCDLFNESSNLPDEREMQVDNGSNFDTCDSSANSPCLARLILYNVAKFIGKHNAEWFYRDLSLLSLKRSLRTGVNHAASDIWSQQTAQLFCHSLNLPQPCNPVATFDERMWQNKLAFQAFGDKFAKFAQGQGGASVFKPVVGNQSNFDAGQGG